MRHQIPKADQELIVVDRMQKKIAAHEKKPPENQEETPCHKYPKKYDPAQRLTQ
jgi:hypothetical protein